MTTATMMMMMIIIIITTIMTMTIVSVEQRPGWGEPVLTQGGVIFCSSSS
jgi:hypothetical protein